MNSYHNTTEVSEELEFEHEEKAITQDQEVLNVFREYMLPMTVYQAFDVSKTNMMMSSFKRSVSNLYNAGLLEKGDKVMERYGRENYTYKIS